MSDSDGGTPAGSEGPPTESGNARTGSLELLRILLPAIGVFGALCYFLGRLYVGSYYYALGMTPGLLQFSAEDYMFSSFELVLMCGILVFYLLWFYRLPIPLLGPRWRKLDYWTYVAILIALLAVSGIGTWLIWTAQVSPRGPGVMGLGAGLIVAFGAASIVTLLRNVAVKLIRNARVLSSVDRYLSVVVAILLFVVVVPNLARGLAQIEAWGDVANFPPVELLCTDQLPSELRKSSTSEGESVRVGLILSNEGMTYVLRIEDGPALDLDGDERLDEEVDEEGQTRLEWKIYALPQASIQRITFVGGYSEESAERAELDQTSSHPSSSD